MVKSTGRKSRRSVARDTGMEPHSSQANSESEEAAAARERKKARSFGLGALSDSVLSCDPLCLCSRPSLTAFAAAITLLACFLAAYAGLCAGLLFHGSQQSQFCTASRPFVQHAWARLLAVEHQWNSWMTAVELSAAPAVTIHKPHLLEPALLDCIPDAHGGSTGTVLMQTRTVTQSLPDGIATHAVLASAADLASAVHEHLQTLTPHGGGGVGSVRLCCNCSALQYRNRDADWCAKQPDAWDQADQDSAPDLAAHVQQLVKETGAEVQLRDRSWQVQALQGPGFFGVTAGQWQCALSASLPLGRMSADAPACQRSSEVSAEGGATTGSKPEAACAAAQHVHAVLPQVLPASAAAAASHARQRRAGETPLPGTVEPASIDEGALFELMASPSMRHHLWAGSDGTATSLHFDTEHNVYSQVHGVKHWLLLDPTAWWVFGTYPAGHHGWRQTVQWGAADQALRQCGDPDGASMLAPVCLRVGKGGGAVSIACGPCAVQPGDGATRVPATVVTLSPGSTLYVPPMWLHAVLSRAKPSTPADAEGVHHPPSVAVNSWIPDTTIRQVVDELASVQLPLGVYPHTDIPALATILRSYVWSVLRAVLGPVTSTAKLYLRQARQWQRDAVGSSSEAELEPAAWTWAALQHLAQLEPHCFVDRLWLARWQQASSTWAGHQPGGNCSAQFVAGGTGSMPGHSCARLAEAAQGTSPAVRRLLREPSPWRNAVAATRAQHTLAELKGESRESTLHEQLVHAVQASGMAIISLLPDEVRRAASKSRQRSSPHLSAANAVSLASRVSGLVRGWAVAEVLLGDHIDEAVTAVMNMALPLRGVAGMVTVPSGQPTLQDVNWLTQEEAQHVLARGGLYLSGWAQSCLAPCDSTLRQSVQAHGARAAVPSAADVAGLWWHALVQPQRGWSDL